jgi:hypothetical protein
MHLPYIRRAAPEVLATVRAQRWDPSEVLKVLTDRSNADGPQQRVRIPQGWAMAGDFRVWRNYGGS